MNRIISLLIIFCVSVSIAQADTWYHGYVILKSTKKLKGELSIQHEYDVVLFRIGSEITVLPAYKVESVWIIDEEAQSNREFVPIQLYEGVATAYRFFEKVVSGDCNVLRRQHTSWYSLHMDVLDYDYFIATPDGQLVPMNKFRKRVYPNLVATTDGKIKEYTHLNRLTPGRLVDSILIVRHYNLLQLDASALAKN